jgi:hypothetical protein
VTSSTSRDGRDVRPRTPIQCDVFLACDMSILFGCHEHDSGVVCFHHRERPTQESIALRQIQLTMCRPQISWLEGELIPSASAESPASNGRHRSLRYGQLTLVLPSELTHRARLSCAIQPYCREVAFEALGRLFTRESVDKCRGIRFGWHGCCLPPERIRKLPPKECRSDALLGDQEA